MWLSILNKTSNYINKVLNVIFLKKKKESYKNWIFKWNNKSFEQENYFDKN